MTEDHADRGAGREGGAGAETEEHTDRGAGREGGAGVGIEECIDQGVEREDKLDSRAGTGGVETANSGQLCHQIPASQPSHGDLPVKLAPFNDPQ